MPKTKHLITLATQNEGKLRELQAYCDGMTTIELVLPPGNTYPEIEETGSDFLENARIKASQFIASGLAQTPWVLAEDSGLAINALDGRYGLSPFPGIHTKRWLTPARYVEIAGASARNIPIHQPQLNHAVLTLLASETNRHAQYLCGMVLFHNEPGQGLAFEQLGTMDLAVIDDFNPRGNNGFGYDPIMHPVIHNVVSPLTVAELDMTLKNQLSHRGKAFQQVLDYLARL